VRLRRNAARIGLSPEERGLVLAGLFELRLRHAADLEQGDTIKTLVTRLGGDPEAVFFGAYDERKTDDSPVPEYPADETDEG
jgi:hypothetical protein